MKITKYTTVRELLERYDQPGRNILIEAEGFQLHNLSSEHYRFWDRTIEEIAIYNEINYPYRITRGREVLLEVEEPAVN